MRCSTNFEYVIFDKNVIFVAELSEHLGTLTAHKF